MNIKNKKTWLVILISVIVLLAAVLIVALITTKLSKQDTSKKINIERVQPTESSDPLDQFIEKQKGFMSPETAARRGLKNKEIFIPVKTNNSISKIITVPKIMAGGDIVYAQIAEKTDGSFTVLGPADSKNLFVIESPEEAAKYIDFMMVGMGQNAYERIRKTIWSTDDYKQYKCQDNKNNNSAANFLPVTQAKKSGQGFEVSWIYYTPAVQAGYWKTVYNVSEKGEAQIKEKSEKPFIDCGKGMVF